MGLTIYITYGCDECTRKNQLPDANLQWKMKKGYLSKVQARPSK
jgi:hypothetical protein